MKIAIHAADLDHDRIDGTRVYIKNVLAHLGRLAPEDYFLVVHKNSFNKELAPPELGNYRVKALGKFPAWTHTKFAWEIFRQSPDVLWVPLHNLPWLRRKKLRTVVTIHDLAFKFFPDYFTRKDLFKLNLLADHAVREADKIIAISEATKRDILKLYPGVKEGKISVVHHGFDAGLFQRDISKEEQQEVLARYKIRDTRYILYVGAIQPRKNLAVLIEAFEKIKKEHPEMKLVIAGARAWHWEETAKRIASSPFAEDIVETGKIPFAHQPALYRNAAAFVFPSLYEGFGIPVLEAFASSVPVILADNSSLPEVGGEAALYFEAGDSDALAAQLERILEDGELRSRMVEKGRERLKEFSWEKCARETLAIIRKM